MKRLAAVACCLVIAGCTGAPNALRMALVPEKAVFALHEPIHIRATLTAGDGYICLGKAGVFDVEVRRTDSTEPMKSPPRGVCGTGFAISLPLFPILAAVALLDVADTLDRYTVLSPGEKRTHLFEVLPDESLPAGRYQLRATLADTLEFRYLMNLYPAPLFWRVYDAPVVAEAEFVIAKGRR